MNNQINKQIDIRRANLIEKSQQARKYKEEQLNNAKTEAQLLYWQSVRINDIIASWYKEETGASEFKTFAQWKKEGYNIIKGSKAYVLWSRKKEVTKQDASNEESKELSYEFFPIAYLFSNLQVEKRGAKNEN